MGKHTPDGLKTAVNPFIETLEIPVVILNKYESRVDPKNIKVQDGIVTTLGGLDQIKKSYFLEKDRSINVYYENNGIDLRPYFLKLSKEGRILLEYVLLYCLRQNALYCNIDTADFMKVYEVSSRTTVWNAKKCLLDAGFISATAYKGWFWINPKFFFKGERSRCIELKDNLMFKK